MGAASLAEALFGNPAKSSVITNWRARIAGFPAERRKGEFDLVAVHDWMQDHRRDDLVRLVEQGSATFTPLWWWAQSVRAYADVVTVPTARSEVMALVLLAHLLLADRDDDLANWMVRIANLTAPTPALAAELANAIRRMAKRTEAKHPDARGLLVQPLGALDERGTLVIELLRRLADAALGPTGILVPGPLVAPVLELREEQRRGKKPETATPATIARLMAELAHVGPQDSVLDPACGEGELLLAAGARALGAGTGGTLGNLAPLAHQRPYAGVEIGAGLAVTARSRFLLADLSVDVTIDDSVRNDPLRSRRFDVVLVDPPVPPGARSVRPELGRWLSHALAHAEKSGRVVVLLPAAVLVLAAKGRPTSGGLLANLLPVDGPADRWAHRVNHVVLLPRRTRTDIAGRACLVSLMVGETAAVSPKVGFLELSDAVMQDPGGLRTALKGVENLSVQDVVERLAGPNDPGQTGNAADVLMRRDEEISEPSPYDWSEDSGLIYPELLRNATKRALGLPVDLTPAVQRLSQLLEPLLAKNEDADTELVQHIRNLLEEAVEDYTWLASKHRERSAQGGTP